MFCRCHACCGLFVCVVCCVCWFGLLLFSSCLGFCAFVVSFACLFCLIILFVYMFYLFVGIACCCLVLRCFELFACFACWFVCCACFVCLASVVRSSLLLSGLLFGTLVVLLSCFVCLVGNLFVVFVFCCVSGCYVLLFCCLVCLVVWRHVWLLGLLLDFLV